LLKGFTVGSGYDEFPLEKNIRNMSMRPNCYVIGFLDCCRSIPKADLPIPEKIPGQLILIYAVGPGKSAMSRGEKDGLSAVTGQFLHQLRCCSNETFPKGIALWVKHHPTAEIVEKAKFEIGLITNAVLLSDNTKQKKKFENWSPSEVAEWLSKLNLSKDYR